MKNRTTVERKSERELVVTRTVNGPARIVFEAWTKPETVLLEEKGALWQRGSPMAGNVVNLNRVRKKKLREERAKKAEINRVRHGRTQAQKDRERTDRERAARMLEGKRLEAGNKDESDE